MSHDKYGLFILATFYQLVTLSFYFIFLEINQFFQRSQTFIHPTPSLFFLLFRTFIHLIPSGLLPSLWNWKLAWFSVWFYKVYHVTFERQRILYLNPFILINDFFYQLWNDSSSLSCPPIQPPLRISNVSKAYTLNICKCTGFKVEAVGSECS